VVQQSETKEMSYLIVWLNHLGECLCHRVVHIRMGERVKLGAEGGGGLRGVCGDRRQTKFKSKPSSNPQTM